MTLEIGRRWVNGRWTTDIENESGGEGGGGSLPANVTWDENALTVHDADPNSGLLPLFRLKTLIADGLEFVVRVTAYFTGAVTTYNDNGDELLESDPLANGGTGEVRIHGVAVTQPDLSGYQQTDEKGQANGYASLDSDGLVPTAQLPETPAVVPDVAYTDTSSGSTLSQGNVTADAANIVRWQRIGRTVHARCYLQTETVGQEGEVWLVDLAPALPAIEYSGGANGPLAVGSGYVVTDTKHVITVFETEDAGGPGPTRRIAFAVGTGTLGEAGASEQMGPGSELQFSLVYEAATAAA